MSGHPDGLHLRSSQSFPPRAEKGDTSKSRQLKEKMASLPQVSYWHLLQVWLLSVPGTASIAPHPPAGTGIPLTSPLLFLLAGMCWDYKALSSVTSSSQCTSIASLWEACITRATLHGSWATGWRASANCLPHTDKTGLSLVVRDLHPTSLSSDCWTQAPWSQLFPSCTHFGNDFKLNE